MKSKYYERFRRVILVIAFLKKYWIQLLLSVFIGLFVIPFLIHTAFKIPAVCAFWVSDWTAGDMLGFYGVLLGAAATVGGVFLSIKYAQENYQKDTIYRSLPFMSIKGINKQLNEMSTEDFKNGLFYIIKHGNVSIARNLTSDQWSSLSHCGIVTEYTTAGAKMINRNLFAQIVDVENIGNGAAATFSVGIDKQSNIEKSQNFSLAKSLKVGESFRFIVFSENPDESNIGDYAVCVSYYDILGNLYEQRLKYRINKDNTDTLYASLELDGTQVPIAGRK